MNRTIRIAASTLILVCAAAAYAQTSSSTPPVSSQTIQETEKNTAKKKSKVILQRSTDADGNVTETRDPSQIPAQVPAQAPAQLPATSQPAPATPQQEPTTPAQPNQIYLHAGPIAPPPVRFKDAATIEDSQRSAPVCTDFDMDVRLRPAEGQLAVRALITVRNDGKTALQHLPLQLSSTLNWESIRQNARPLPFTVALLNSDTDHTGQLHEADVTLAAPLAPGATIQLDVAYSGAVAQSTKRLQAIGTPDDVAATSDWDRISAEFTGLRGFGNVVWYPVSSVPVILGDGARLFDEIGTHKLRLAGSHFRMSLTVETPPNSAPTVAMVNGHPVPLTVIPGPDATVATVATAKVEDAVLGFEAPSLFLANWTSHAAANATLWTRPESEGNVAAWRAAATDVTPFLQSWLGMRPRSQLTILELPEEADIPFETGAMLATPMRAAGPEVLDGILAHALTHAWVMSPRAWLSEGVAHFMGTLWIEKQQGRERALATLDNARTALALAEPESPGASEGQPLTACISPVYYRTKATYVFWMLRDMVGDAALSAALRAYDPAKDSAPESFEKLIEQAGQRRDLSWFFADWVYADKGLPDLSIEGVFPTSASVAGSYIVAVNASNNGYAAVEAPIQIVSGNSSQTQRVILQARSKITQRILIQGAPSEVRLNDGTIPETQATIHVKTLDGPKP